MAFFKEEGSSGGGGNRLRLYESSKLDEYVRTDGHRNGWPSSKKKAVVEAVGIEPTSENGPEWRLRV